MIPTDKKDILDKLKSPQWRIVIAILIIFIFLYIWGQFFNLGKPIQYAITYSQFIEQLEAGNIDSVKIKELEVTGSFNREVNLICKVRGRH